jgi:hypothetical protein
MSVVVINWPQAGAVVGPGFTATGSSSTLGAPPDRLSELTGVQCFLYKGSETTPRFQSSVSQVTNGTWSCSFISVTPDVYDLHAYLVDAMGERGAGDAEPDIVIQLDGPEQLNESTVVDE